MSEENTTDILNLCKIINVTYALHIAYMHAVRIAYSYIVNGESTLAMAYSSTVEIMVYNSE